MAGFAQSVSNKLGNKSVLGAEEKQLIELNCVLQCFWGFHSAICAEFPHDTENFYCAIPSTQVTKYLLES